MRRSNNERKREEKGGEISTNTPFFSSLSFLMRERGRDNVSTGGKKRR